MHQDSGDGAEDRGAPECERDVNWADPSGRRRLEAGACFHQVLGPGGSL
jgi:hypothetical protein